MCSRSLPNPLTLASSPDPEFAYALYREAGDLVWSEDAGAWVASTAAAVADVLHHASCLVRPPGEAVPAVMTGTATGDTFGLLARMTDGDYQSCAKLAIAEALNSVDLARARSLAESHTRRLARSPLDEVSVRAPILVLGELIGFNADVLLLLPDWSRSIAMAIGPASTPEAVTHANVAIAAMQTALEEADPGALFGAMTRSFTTSGLGQSEATANVIGLFFQVFDAMAGLVANTLLTALERRNDHATPGEPIRDVLRTSAPIQNTRRYAEGDCTIAGTHVHEGEAIIVLLASANADDDGYWSFGAGAHRCPGESLALAIAEGCLSALVERDDLERVAQGRWRPSPNARIAILGPTGGES